MAVLAWLWNNTAGNLLASAMAATAVWFWKVRPHLRRQAEHRDAVAAHIARWDGQHEKDGEL